jgi:hypothetical protein
LKLGRKKYIQSAKRNIKLSSGEAPILRVPMLLLSMLPKERSDIERDGKDVAGVK